jgi:hypothetical protein
MTEQTCPCGTRLTYAGSYAFCTNCGQLVAKLEKRRWARVQLARAITALSTETFPEASAHG